MGPRVVKLALATGLVLATGLGPAACFHGFEVEDKEPPPGYPGGMCLVDGCYDAVDCYQDEKVCVDPLDPCKGFYCGGHGTCTVDLDSNLPLCTCDPGYTNEPYAYYCTPVGF